jgi:hypothetical protein
MIKFCSEKTDELALCVLRQLKAMCSDKKHIDLDDELDKQAVMGFIKKLQAHMCSQITARKDENIFWIYRESQDAMNVPKF